MQNGDVAAQLGLAVVEPLRLKHAVDGLGASPRNCQISKTIKMHV